MTHPDSRPPAPSGRPDEPARPATGPDGRGATERFVNPEAALGGADAVQKTSYVVGEGTDPAARAGGGTNAHPRSGHGPNYLAWGIGAVAVLVALVYLVTLLA